MKIYLFASWLVFFLGFIVWKKHDFRNLFIKIVLFFLFLSGLVFWFGSIGLANIGNIRLI